MKKTSLLILALLKSNLIVLAVVSASALSVLWPQVADSLKDTPATSIFIMFVFFLQGIGIRTEELPGWKGLGRISLFCISLLLFISPLLAWLLVQTLELPPDLEAGILLISCMPSTLVSGTVIASTCGGDRTTGMMVTIISNAAAIALLPLLCMVFFASTSELPAGDMFFKLVITILIPALLGILVRKKSKITNKYPSTIKYGPILLLSCVIYLNSGSQWEQLRTMSGKLLLITALLCISHHFLMLFIGYLAARNKFNAKQRLSLAICCSEKTLPVCIAVWSLLMRDSHPGALAVAVIYHFLQILSDGPMARRLQKRLKLD